MTGWPELVLAVGTAIAAVLTAWQARTASQVRELKGKVSQLEDDHRALNARFRVAIAHIRDWMSWWRINHPETMPPPLPPELKDEV